MSLICIRYKLNKNGILVTGTSRPADVEVGCKNRWDVEYKRLWRFYNMTIKVLTGIILDHAINFHENNLTKLI